MQKLFILFSALLTLLPVTAQAELTIEITGGNSDAASIAIAPFSRAGGGTPLTADFAEIIASDLKRSGQFNPVARASQPPAPSWGATVDFGPWKSRGIDHLVTGNIMQSGSGYKAKFSLYDTASARQLMSETVTTKIRDQRFAAHHIADLIYEKLTGKRGAFATRIAYVVANKRHRTLKISDSDGHNAKTVLSSNEPVMSPSWSPDGGRLAYVAFEKGRPGIYVQTLSSGKRIRISNAAGLNGAPTWSPDGSRLAVTLSKDGNPEIYIIGASGGTPRRLTNNQAIDTEPAWSPDGRWIAFTSNRGGKPQIYQIAAGGGSAKRLTYEGSYNADASYAPDGRSLALISRTGGDQVAILDLETRGMQTISSGNLNESPSFAPNGSMVVYAAAGGVLSVVAVDYDVRQRLARQGGEVRDPAWSPFLIGRRR
ncbi:MAG: Tol-Pal system beta propeller repeat protein TolB [Pseudomonadota bacterium]